MTSPTTDWIESAEKHLKDGDRRAARTLMQNALSKDANDLHALHMLSTLDIEDGLVGLALEKIEKVLAAAPEHAPAIYNKGVCLMAKGDLDGALNHFRRSLEIDPRHSGALYNVAYIHRARGQLDEASKTFARLVEMNPAWASAREAYCDTLFIQRRFDDILGLCDAVIQQGKATSITFRQRADAFRALGRQAEAEDAYRNSLQQNAADPGALHGFGGLLQEMGRFADAITVYEREAVVAGQEPAYASSFDPALTEIIRSSRHICAWKNLAFYEDQAVKRIREGAGGIDPVLALAVTDDPQIHQAVARRTWPQGTFPLASKPATKANGSAKLRIGYLFGPFVTQRLAAIAEAHDRNRIETFGYNVAAPNAGDRARAAFANYRDLTAQSNEQIAAAIAADKLDVLIDVMGHAVSARLPVLLYKPAPLIAHFLSFQGSLGSKVVDYVFADAQTIKPGDEAFYDEKPVRLPGSCRPFDNKRRPAAKTLKRADVGLGDSQFIFCAFAEPMLFNPALFDTYMSILKEVPDSRLWLADFGETVRENLRQEATARNVDAQRLVFAEGAPGDELLDRLRLADLFLDTWPYTGQMLMADALWSGVPAVTRTGRSFTSRLGASMLNAAGLGELVASDAASFQRVAVNVARDPAKLAEHKARLANHAQNPLFDTRRFAAHLEQAFEWMVERARKGQPPAAHNVAG